MMFHFHEWSKWEIEEREMIHFRSGTEFIKYYQIRRCSTCGKFQEEVIR